MLKCWRCGITWTPRVEKPKACPNCKVYQTPDKPFIVISETGALPAKRFVEAMAISGKLSLDRQVYCSFCHKQANRVVAIDNKMYCADCIYRLLTEEVDPEERW